MTLQGSKTVTEVYGIKFPYLLFCDRIIFYYFERFCDFQFEFKNKKERNVKHNTGSRKIKTEILVLKARKRKDRELIVKY